MSDCLRTSSVSCYSRTWRISTVTGIQSTFAKLITVGFWWLNVLLHAYQYSPTIQSWTLVKAEFRQMCKASARYSTALARWRQTISARTQNSIGQFVSRLVRYVHYGNGQCPLTALAIALFGTMYCVTTEHLNRSVVQRIADTSETDTPWIDRADTVRRLRVSQPPSSSRAVSVLCTTPHHCSQSVAATDRCNWETMALSSTAVCQRFNLKAHCMIVKRHATQDVKQRRCTDTLNNSKETQPEKNVCSLRTYYAAVRL